MEDEQLTATLPEFVWIWNIMQGLETPVPHSRITHWLDGCWQSGQTRLLLMAFRACGKSTLVGLFCAWVLSLNPNLRILALAAEQTLATKMVRNVKRIIERHPLCQGLKPERVDQWAADSFTVRRSQELRDPSMLARGLGANLTGSRANLVICDDVEVPNTCDTALKRAELRARLSEIDYILIPGGTQLYVGTPHSHFSIYAEEVRSESGEEHPFLGGFQRFKLPILDERGQSAWPERYSLKRIEALRRRHGPNKFRSQMMLEPVNVAEARLNPDLLKKYDEELVYEERNRQPMLLLRGRQLLSASCWWDPAWGGTSKGDHSVIACVLTDVDGLYWLHRVRYLRVAPEASTDAAQQQCQAVADFLRNCNLPSVAVEVNGVGRFLPGLLRTVLRERGQSTAVVEAHSTRPKDIRIVEAFDAVLAAGHLMAHRSVWETPFITEMREWQPGNSRARSDDGLDAVAGCLLSEPVRLRPSGDVPPPTIRRNWSSLGRTYRADVGFSV